MKKKVMVLCGGKSSEHSISCVSASSVARTLESEYEIIPVGITADGEWISLSFQEMRGWSLKSLPKIKKNASSKTVFAIPGKGFFAGSEKMDVDVVFPVLHGLGGEDGAVQGFLETCGVAYVGCGIFASAACMDKHYTKILLKSAGLSVSPGITIDARGGTSTEWVKKKLEDGGVGYPIFVKPAWGGSSVGVSKVCSPPSLGPALEKASKVSWKILLEQDAMGREIECGVFCEKGKAPLASLPGEIISARSSFYDFEAKYENGPLSRVEVPARLEEGKRKEIQETAISAFKAVGGRELMRVDVFLTEEGKILVNEINTMPGFTEVSMYPSMWKELGIGYKQMLVNLVENAI